jgi:hypothetical protein
MGWVGLGWVGLGRVGSGRVGSGRVGSGRVGFDEKEHFSRALLTFIHPIFIVSNENFAL